jgi:hypothetical protein
METIQTTTNYDQFKPIDGNRKLIRLHVKKLTESMRKNYLFTVILVNEKFEIIDGQHRFECAKELKLPINYVMVNGYGLNEVHIFNQNSKTWNADDYLDGYCQLEYPVYIEYKKFKNKYKFGHNECMLLLSNASTGRNVEDFKNGKFEIKDLKIAMQKAEKIIKLSKHYSGWNRRSFVFAMNTMLNNPAFDFDVFMDKLEYLSMDLVDCVTTEKYIELIKKIYNYKNRLNKI